MDWNILLGQTASIATVIAAGVAIFIYLKGKRDELQNAARSIILEIRESERVVRTLLDLKNSDDAYPENYVRLIPFRAWEKYSHLFIKRLNNDEYDHINGYYRRCEVLERYLTKNHNFFWITTEERARQKETLGSKLAWEEPELTGAAFRDKLERICARYFADTARYTPTGIKMEIDKTLASIIMVTSTPTWNKLKKIASYNDLLG